MLSNKLLMIGMICVIAVGCSTAVVPPSRDVAASPTDGEPRLVQSILNERSTTPDSENKCEENPDAYCWCVTRPGSDTKMCLPRSVCEDVGNEYSKY